MESLDTPMTIGVYGRWGSGKTSVMKLLKARLPTGSRSVWFEAWRYGSDAQTLWRALVSAVAEALRQGDSDRRVNDLLDSLFRTHRFTEKGELKVNWQAVAPMAVRGVLELIPGIGEAAGKAFAWLEKEGNLEKALKILEHEQIEHFRAQTQSLDQFQSALRALVCERIDPERDRLFVFVDDLDRCLGDVAVSVLEAIKVFFDIEGCVFVIGVDRAIVQAGVKQKLQTMSDDDAREYLDKIIHVPFSLPPLSDAQMTSFIKTWCEEHDEPEISKCADLIAAGVAPNPRKVKRSLNVLSLGLLLRNELAAPLASRDDDRTTRALAAITVLQISYEPIYRRVVQNPEYLRQLVSSPEELAKAFEDLTDDGSFDQLRLRAMLAKTKIFEGLNRDQLIDLLFVSRFSEANI
jgi:hypothetical protein